jgi:hypothetical protein
LAKTERTESDSQIKGLIGRNRLVEQLVLPGLDVAIPQRDHGADLVAYANVRKGFKSFVACPIQVKASSAEQFSIDRKFEKIRGLILVFI